MSLQPLILFFYLPLLCMHPKVFTLLKLGWSKIQWRRALGGKTECLCGLEGPWDRTKWWKKSCMDPNIRYILGLLESLRIKRGTLILLSSYIPGSTEPINVIAKEKKGKGNKEKCLGQVGMWSKTTPGQLCRCSLCQLEYQRPPQCSCSKIVHKSLWLELSSGLIM